MAGYQGWFNTPEDGAGLGWKHFEKEKEFKPGKCTIDLWPDVSEYEKTYETAFKLPDETPAKVLPAIFKQRTYIVILYGSRIARYVPVICKTQAVKTVQPVFCRCPHEPFTVLKEMVDQAAG